MIRQRLTRRVLCGLVLSVSMAGCSDSSSPTGPTGGPSSPSSPQVVDRTVTFAIGGGTTVSNGTSTLQVGFRRVVSDSRCPGDALCLAGVAAGVAVLELDATITENGFSLGSRPQVATDGPNSELRIGVYTVDIQQLTPYPFASLPPIKPEDWRATVRITSALD
jgi:hypothetical protein